MKAHMRDAEILAMVAKSQEFEQIKVCVCVCRVCLANHGERVNLLVKGQGRGNI